MATAMAREEGLNVDHGDALLFVVEGQARARALLCRGLPSSKKG
jgi:hypothetical protein